MILDILEPLWVGFTSCIRIIFQIDSIYSAVKNIPLELISEITGISVISLTVIGIIIKTIIHKVH